MLYGKRVFLYKFHPCCASGYHAYGPLAQANDRVLAASVGSMGDAWLRSWNLRTGKLLRTYFYEYAPGGPGDVYQLVTTATGSLAWIALSTSHEEGAVEVDKDDSSGFATLDFQILQSYFCPPSGCGDMIDTTYLSASDGMVFWKANAALMSAPFS